MKNTGIRPVEMDGGSYSLNRPYPKFIPEVSSIIKRSGHSAFWSADQLISNLNTTERKGDEHETINGDEAGRDSVDSAMMNKKQFQHLDIFPMEDHRAEFRELVRAAAGARVAGKQIASRHTRSA
jgi:hypothetical protein